jgi:hypothetical protein
MGSRTPSSVPGVLLKEQGETGESMNRTVNAKSDIRSVTRQEVVACLLGREPAYRREDTERIACKHDNVAGLAVDHARYMRIRDKFNRIRAARVLRNANIVIVGRSRSRVVNDVLKDATKADRVVDLGLLRGGEVDALGITTALNVEDTSVGPDVLVITDEKAPRVSTERCLARSRQAKEECHITLVDAHVCRRM